jgi:hypothetical protein
MITLPEAFTGLYAAWRLFLRDARALALFDATPAGALKSFWCAAIVLPGYAVIVFVVHPLGIVDIDWFRFVLVEAVAYAVKWCAWPLLMFYVAQALDRSDRYLLYLNAYNWSAGPQIAVWLLVLIVVFSGVFSRDVAVIINIAAMIVLLLYHLFIIRMALKLTFFVALGLVIGEAMVAQIIEVIRDSMMGG